MESKIPFTSYDFWAYLSAGFLLLFVADYVAETDLLSRPSWTIVQGIVAVAIAYAVGQLVASASSLLFERLLVGKLLGYPRTTLFGKARAWKWVRALMPSYFKCLPEETRQAGLVRGAAIGVNGPGEALFWAAYAHARAAPVVMARLDNFLNLYAFCRNTALVAFLNAAMLFLAYRRGRGSAVDLYWCWASLALGIGMTMRYLKFYRLYAVEVFTAYAYSESAPGEGK